MATASEAGGSRYQTFYNNYAHCQPLLWALMALSGVWQGVTDSSVARSIGWLLTLALWSSFFAEWKHSRSLCEKCAFLTPLNTEVAVERNIRWLGGIHWVTDHPGRWILILLSFLALSCMPLKTGQLIGSVGLDLVIGAQVLCALKHRVLQPWCPMCKWGGGGDEEFSPEPAPPPEIRADR